MDFILPSSTGFTIYTKSNCKYCTLVKELLYEDIRNNNVLIVDCDNYLQPQTKEVFIEFIRQCIGSNQQYRTFPMVFLGGNFVGGYTETRNFIEQKDAFSDLL